MRQVVLEAGFSGAVDTWYGWAQRPGFRATWRLIEETIRRP